MLRLGIAVLAFIVWVECWPASKEHGLLLERLKRSPHYCGPEYQERRPPPPQAPQAPPELPAPPAPATPETPTSPAPPSSPAPPASPARPAPLAPRPPPMPFYRQPPMPFYPEMPFYPPPPFWPGHHHHHHRFHGFEYQPKFNQFRDYQNNSPPCDTCKDKGTNSAVSNAESETGNAIAIAISRSKPM